MAPRQPKEQPYSRWPCLLMGELQTWSVQGFSDINNLDRETKYHDKCKDNIGAAGRDGNQSMWRKVNGYNLCSTMPKLSDGLGSYCLAG